MGTPEGTSTEMAVEGRRGGGVFRKHKGGQPSVGGDGEG